MTDSYTRIAVAIAEHLQDELIRFQDTQVDGFEDKIESLEVALQCLEATYGFELAQDSRRLGLRPATLATLLAPALGARDQAKASNVPSTADASPPSYNESETMEKAEALKEQGNEALRSADYTAAVKLYTEAIAVCSTNAIYYVNRAAAFTKLEQFDKAIADCRQGLTIDPAYSKAYSRLGTCYFTQGDYEQAKAAYAQALELEPTNNMYADNLKAATQRLVDQSGVPASEPAAPSSGRTASMPQMPAGLDFAALMNNPQMMDMARKMMESGSLNNLLQNPQVMDMFQSMQNQGGR